MHSKRVVFGVSLLLLVGCSADHTIADDPRTSADRLRERVEEFCNAECPRVVSCSDSRGDCVCEGDSCECGPTLEDCQEDCRELFVDGYAAHGEVCSELGNDYMDCVAATPCAELANPVSCRAIRDASDACEAGDSDEPPGVGGGPGVSCSSGFGTAGTAGGTGAPNPETACDQGWDDCSDGHGYRLICLADAAGSASCTCFVDGAPAGSFVPSSLACPPVNEINAGCGWSLR